MSRAHARRRPSLPDFFLGITEGLEEASTACIVESAVAAITNEVGFDVPAAPDDEDLAESLTDRDAPFIWRPEVLAEELDDEHESEGDAVLDPFHPPTYYIPPEDINMAILTANTRQTFCEWKGVASYYDFSAASPSVKSRIWTYKNPTEKFMNIKDHLSFYASPWKCFVDGELVVAQPGDFYGGWLTSDIDGGHKGVKGPPGTEWW
ncbi:hypothetical protein FRB98_001935 [Tulasnella sp. 332]|nr:hypothetical protein FRB98_001935 [Tulasnella sp. 332]